MRSKFICFLTVFLIFTLATSYVFAYSIDEEQIYEKYINEKFEYGIYKHISDRYNNGEYGEEIYCLGIEGAWMEYETIVVYQKNDEKKMIVYGANGRFRRRNLTDDEYDNLISYIKINNIAKLDDFYTGMVMDGVWYDYFHITKDGREYVYINNPEVYSDSEFKVYNELVTEFRKLLNSGEFEVGYNIEDAELILNEDYPINAVWKNEDDFRILIFDEENSKFLEPTYKWVSIKDGNVGTKAKKPDIFKTPLESTPDEFQARFNNATSAKWNGYSVCSFDNKLYLLSGKAIISTISDNAYNSPVVVPDTDYVVCEKNVNGWDKPTRAVKINLITFEETKLNLPAHLDITPLTVLNGKVLFCGCDSLFFESEKKIKFYLYDIQSDTYEHVNEDFICYLQDYIETRPLQPTSEKGKYYALTDKHTVGVFDTETGKFTALFSSPVPIQNNDHMWIDENDGIIYIAVNNDLLALPINIPEKEQTVSVFVDNKEVTFDVAPTIESGRTIVPMRFIFEALGAKVSWDDATSTATAEKDGVILKIKIGESIMYKNGEPIELDVCAKLEQSRTLVPLRAIAEGFGTKVEWNGLKRSVTIIS
ncbi:MAG: copper amine oxidase N-terminal domain-containing protein [Clostridia bacterium]|nr:copper amine oxidase N-terminal domain-containing protein [Clostridia bacterium]